MPHRESCALNVTRWIICIWNRVTGLWRKLFSAIPSIFRTEPGSGSAGSEVLIEGLRIHSNPRFRRHHIPIQTTVAEDEIHRRSEVGSNGRRGAARWEKQLSHW